jgi:hypothetical protein
MDKDVSNCESHLNFEAPFRGSESWPSSTGGRVARLIDLPFNEDWMPISLMSSPNPVFAAARRRQCGAH